MDGFFPWLRLTWLRLTVLPVLVLLAERDLRRGELASARDRFMRCARLVPYSFRAHFGLARVYLRARDYGLARREILLAEQISPARFARSRAQLPDAPRSSRSSGTVRGPVPGQSPSSRVSPALREVVQWVGTSGLYRPSYGDCADRDEWEKFQRMGPIRVAEGWGVDWGQVAARLCDDETQPG
jgi:hypothetical protein